ncbi:MAG: permease [Candidatus Aquicultor sp.]|nr:permease [Candidatus Aquicultor sp.]
MIFFDIITTFRNLTLDILPLVIISLVLAAVLAQYFSPRSLDRMIQSTPSRAVLASSFFGVFLPATTGCRVPMAAIARKSGAAWAPVLTFIAAGSAAGISTLIVTLLLGWQLAVLRIIVALLSALVLSLIITKFIEPRFAMAAMDCEVEPLFDNDFCEYCFEAEDEAPPVLRLSRVWRSLVRSTRVVVPWLALSLLLASLIEVVVSKETVTALLGGPLEAPKAALLGLPFYFVFGADVPIIYVLLKKGLSLGGAVALMLAAPVVNAPVLAMVGRWLGYRRALVFVALCWLVASAIGMLFGYIDAR